MQYCGFFIIIQKRQNPNCLSLQLGVVWLLFWEMALSVSYWSPMEKLILHLSPVARRRTLKNNSTNSTSCNNTSSLGRINRHRNRSEPNPNSRAASMKNVSVFTTTITQSDSNSLNCDVKTLRLFYINQVRLRYLL